ncbi:filamentous haemagglutinin family protein [Tardiphaga robiniae]|uniref:Filamentous haemagglutinin FhaB/tRNA nuclease CdiA-like TPS domain-containing protein n=1 Tax=Tardiphaga robiniae TaxID=943830 RepID=A0A163ZST3_9BRAD|nr:filamentous haemagglutinin family protein [Tardiphaga robiniae]KZD23820.1 hypothetical protein A4A58_26130 [Tardiphaga robiniae]
MTIREAAPRRHPAARRSKPGGSSREALLASVSALVLVLATAQEVDARALNGAAAPGNSAAANASVAAQAAAVQAAAAAQRSRDSLNRAASALQSMRQLQGAAAAAARAGASTVPNGVGPGGLKPVTNPLLSAQDQLTGLNTWDGALLPTQSVAADGRVDVNIRQTQSNAILSWESFNVGRDTRLTFDQQGNANWVALNRVVGNDLAPSRILGSIKSDGTVLVINRNGIIFGGSSQINVGSLMASSIDVGPASVISGSNSVPTTISQRNQMFLQYGLLGYAETVQVGREASTFSALQGAVGQGPVEVQKGASITTSRDDGLLLLIAPEVVNSGYLSAPKGQVALASGTMVQLLRASGAADSTNPNIRGLLVGSGSTDPANPGYVWNKSEGLIEAAQGNITLRAGSNGSKLVNTGNDVVNILVPGGAIINDGVLWSTTSVSRNGSIVLSAADIRLSSGSLISIGADSSGETIPQDAVSLANFKPSDIRIGGSTSNIEMQSGALVYAPGGNVTFGAPSGATTPGQNGSQTVATPSIFIDRGAIIDVAGLTDVLIPASRNEVVISPVKGNELRDSSLYRAGFLNGATVYLDPRLSGVRADGVAWIGSPLIDAASYYALVGVSAAELMTKGGNVTLGATAYNGTSTSSAVAIPGSAAASIIVKSGAVINMAGGWVTYEAGKIRSTMLVSSSGRRVSIGNADPNDSYVGIYNGFTVNHARWGIKEVYADTFHSGVRFESEYIEGRDAGTLTLKMAAASFDGMIYGDAFAGDRQRVASKTGSGKSTIYGDKRAVQGATSELPAGGMLFVQADSGGGNIRISHDPAPLPEDFDYGQKVVIGPDGRYVYSPRDPSSILPAARLNTITISDRAISNAGLSEVALYSGGSITVDADAKVALNPGGVFDAFAGRKIGIAGSISAPGGRVMLETYYGIGSIFEPAPVVLGSFDIVVAGSISVAGRWANDFNTSSLDPMGSAWLSGGSISMYVASRDLQLDGPRAAFLRDYGLVDYNGPGTSLTTTDISGSILINAGARLNLAGGGRIDQRGKLTTTAKGGNLSLRSDAGYFQISTDANYDYGRLRVATTGNEYSNPGIVNNPSQINARIVFDPDAIEAHGFGGGGTFTLVTPQIAFGEGTPTTGTVLPLDFFSTAGFATYNITSYKTDLSPSTFDNGKGGYNAILATQTLTVGAGQTLLLAQSVLPSLLNPAQIGALRNLTTGGDLLSVLSPIVPDDAWDSKAVNLNLGGLLELHVAQGGRIIGAAGSTLAIPKLFNEGTIRLPGGTITQQLVLPSLYAGGFNGTQGNEGAVHALSDIFSVGANGLIDPNALNAKGIKAPDGRILTNAEVAGDQFHNYKQAIYLLGLLDADQGVVLAPGSVTDLSGAAILNPRAMRPDRSALTTGRIIAGGTLALLAASQDGTSLFAAQQNSVFAQIKAVGWRMPQTIVARPGSVLDLSGASAAFDQLAGNARLDNRGEYVSTPVWSDAGMLIAANGATLSGATIRAAGGAPQANGGTLVILDPILTQHDPALPVRNVVSADMIREAGFDTLAAIGSVSSLGDATVELGRGFFLQGRPYNSLVAVTSTSADPLLPVIRSGGRLEIDAPYIGILSSFDTISNPNIGTAGAGTVVFNAGQIDISGAVIFDRSVASATLRSSGDIRLTGVQQWQRTYLPTFVPTEYTLAGALAVNGDLSLIAGQVYPTTGSTFTISSTAANGTVTFGRSGSTTPAAPYSAGGNLNVYAANIRQGGVVRVPFGTLTLGSNTPYAKTVSSVTSNFAPATQSVTLLDGSITGVSANGLVIPYGITTDQKEWYFAPTSVEALNGPPLKVMQISGANVAINAGATVDLTGGGDVYAYEFIPGTGGSRDVLDRFNSDQYSGNKGYQYADGRQVYAIVPGLSAPTAVYDPLYSADYANLYSASGIGRGVYLDAAPGLTAGWYTLLPAKYAMLPGGMRVVEQTASGVYRGTGAQTPDGSLYVSGFYGDALADTAQSDIKGFNVQSQAVILQNSRIALTSGDTIARNLAASNGTLTPRLGIDAGRLVLNPLNALSIDVAVSATAAPGGRGSQVDIGGRNFDIVSHLADAPADGAIHVTADSLTRLNAGSLLIGGIRTDNSDGTTSFNITAQTILVANDAAHPLSAAEIVLVVDDQITNPVASRITLADGAALIATGVLTDQRSGNYIIDGRVTTTVVNGRTYYTNPLVTAEGALFRVANGPERLVTRLKDSQTPAVPSASLIVGNIIAKADAVGLDTSGTVSVAGNAVLQAKSISLGAPKIAFTSGAGAVGTVVLTPQLQALLSQGDQLTLHAQSTIGFDDGIYRFTSVNFDAQNLLSLEGGNVAIVAGRLGLGNSTGTAGTAAGGSGVLDVSADEVRFGSGALATTGFGAGVRLTATNGVFSGGTGGVFDVGGANLTITTPYLGDRAVAATATESGSDLTFRSTGAVLVTNAGLASIDASKVSGIPGSALSIEGNGIVVSGTHLRATAGAMTLRSSAGIVLSDAALLETPGYEKVFGDSADAVIRSSPGGTLTLSAEGAAGINLGNATLSVGGGKGNGGKLTLSTPNGTVDLANAVLNGSGGAGFSGGSFALDTKSAIDLVGLNNRVGALGFTGGFQLRTRSGDIVLAAGQTLRSSVVNLTADGGFVTIGGLIDTSGVNGGDVFLYGAHGVNLLASAKLDASASGYAADDTRQARGGNVTLGTDFIPGTAVTQADGSITGMSGAIHVASGASIDVSARRPGDRLVRLLRNGVIYYQYAEGDQGGTVNLRAPVVDNGSGGKTVNVVVDSVASVVGARAIDLEGFKRWDLKAVANSGLYSGVTYYATDTMLPDQTFYKANTIALDVAAGLDTANPDGTPVLVAGLNFLGDNGTGTVVEFVQGFSLSGLDAKLGGLASQSNFQARPGVDLTHSGNIDLNSNWNLGAGVVDVTRAIADQVMAVDPVTGPYVIFGKEAQLLADYTTMTYRVGGRATGAAPILSLRAGGNLHLKGSVTDGFFQFRDQYDPTFQAFANATSNDTTLQLLGGDYSGNFVDWLTYTTDGSPWTNFYNLFFDSFSKTGKGIDELSSGGGGARPQAPNIPFNALGNSAAALSSGAGGVGDALASAVVFPQLPGGQIAASSSYRLTAGAVIGSADPTRVVSTGIGALIVDGAKPTTMTVTNASAPGAFLIEVYDGFYGPVDNPFRVGSMDFDTYLQNLFPGLTGDSVISLPFASVIPSNFQAFINDTLAADPSAHVTIWLAPDQAYGYPEVSISLSLFSQFLQQNPGGFGGGGGGTTTIPLIRQTMIRTGTGNISMAAAGDVDLRGPATPVYLNASGAVTSVPPLDASGTTNPSQQLGGAAVYTAGHIADTTTKLVSGVTINPASYLPTASVFSAPRDYDYGVRGPSETGIGTPGVVMADPVYLDGGGDVNVTAGRDILGRRDLSLAEALRRYGSPTWVGTRDQPWRIGTIGTTTSAAINPQLFREGLGALGGGNILVSAGRDVSTISMVADTSLVTATVTPSPSLATRALLTFGGGNVTINAARDILGGRLDVGSGTALLSAGRNIGNAAAIVTGVHTEGYNLPGDTGPGQIRYVYTTLADQLRVRISDATADLSAGGSIALQGVMALGVASGPSMLGAGSFTAVDNLYGFYSAHSGLSLLANGSITVANKASVGLSGTEGYIDFMTTPGDNIYTAVYPASFSAASIAGDVNVIAGTVKSGNDFVTESNILMVPSAHGQLQLFAGHDIAPTTIAMLDSDPGQLPGLFSTYFNSSPLITGGIRFEFPAVYSSTSDYVLSQQHNRIATHGEDREPIYLYAGNDIGTADQGLTISVPKQARISAGRDITNMMFFGQNLADTDITRIVAGRDITATTKLVQPLLSYSWEYPNLTRVYGAARPALQGNTFILGGPGDLFVEAGRNMGPFLNSSVSVNLVWPSSFSGDTYKATLETYGGGILSVGNQRNPYLPSVGANVNVLFGVGKGADYDGLREAYVVPGSAANALGDYGAKLVDWMRENAGAELLTKYNTTKVSADDAYAVFVTLPELRQRNFLIKEVYFNELAATADPKGPSYLKYSRGYAAVNTLFPASLGYTANGLEGGASDNALVSTGDLDLRLAAIETMYGGDVSIVGPGGRVIAGSVVATSQQAERRAFDGGRLFSGGAPFAAGFPTTSRSIPAGYEGVLALRGGNIYTFTDGDFLLNQSRLFTEQGGDIKMWSSNGDLNAGQGPKTSANFPPIVAHIDQNAVITVDVLGGVTGAGIAALKSTPDAPDADVYLIAPRGKVDAGDAGVRVSGNLSVAALVVVNADNFKVGGTTAGIPIVQAPNVTGLSAASNANTATQQTAVPGQGSGNSQPSVIIVEVLGYGGGDQQSPPRPDPEEERRRNQTQNTTQDPRSRYQIVGGGAATEEEAQRMAEERRVQIGR